MGCFGSELEVTITDIYSLLVACVLTAALAAEPVAPVAPSQPTRGPGTGSAVTPITLSALDSPAAQALAGLGLSPAEQTVQALTSFTLDMVVNCGTHADAAALVVTFDPAYMQVTGVTPDESGFPAVLRQRFDNVSGTVLYDAGSLECHAEGTCPSAAIRVATITFRATARTFPTSYVGLSGQVAWAGELVFDGGGNGSTITIAPPAGVAYFPLVWGGAHTETSSGLLVCGPSDPVVK